MFGFFDNMKYSNLSESAKLAKIIRDPLSIQYMRNPSEQLQRIVVKQSVTHLIHIHNPLPEIIEECIIYNSKSLMFIKYPLKKWILLAIMSDITKDIFRPIDAYCELTNNYTIWKWPEIESIRDYAAWQGYRV